MDLTTYTEDELNALILDAQNEKERRRDIEAIPAEIERLNARYNAAKGPSWPELPQAVEAHKSRNQ